VIVDEEHDPSYKQTETQHHRVQYKRLIFMVPLSKQKIVLGSATYISENLQRKTKQV
jgi:primosomal protein N'